jgi:hypothetical protein
MTEISEAAGANAIAGDAKQMPNKKAAHEAPL